MHGNYQEALYISEHDDERSITKLVNGAKLYLTKMSIHFWKAVISRAVVLLRISKNLVLLGEGTEGRPITQHCRWQTKCGCLLVFSIFSLWATFAYRKALAAHHLSQKLRNLLPHNKFCVLWYYLELCLQKAFQKQVYHRF